MSCECRRDTPAQLPRRYGTKSLPKRMYLRAYTGVASTPSTCQHLSTEAKILGARRDTTTHMSTRQKTTLLRVSAFSLLKPVNNAGINFSSVAWLVSVERLKRGTSFDNERSAERNTCVHSKPMQRQPVFPVWPQSQSTHRGKDGTNWCQRLHEVQDRRRTFASPPRSLVCSLRVE